MPVLLKGRFRFYFNRADAPKVWSIDQGAGTPEICVRELQLKGHLKTDVDLAAEWPNPKAWLEGFGELVVTLNAVGYFEAQ